MASVAAQTCQDFLWLWLVDRDTDLDHQVMLEIAAEPIQGRVVLATNYLGTMRELVQTPYVVATRMDSDDAIGPRFVELLHESVAKELEEYVPLVFNFPRGIYYDCMEGRCIRGYKKFVNQFASLIERTDQARGVYCEEHPNLGRAFPSVWIDTHTVPMWVWSYHGHQISTRSFEEHLKTLVNPRPINTRYLKTFNQAAHRSPRAHGTRQCPGS